MSTIPTIQSKTNGDGVVLMPPTAGERVLAKLLAEAETKSAELEKRVWSLKATISGLHRKTEGLAKALERQLAARQRYEDLYLEEHHKNRQLSAELSGRYRMPSWMADLGRFAADIQGAWVRVGRALSQLRRELWLSFLCLSGRKN
ncbi:MAG: hypothetical protein U0166_02935 [Acidobacteriota bacterium]